MGRAREIQPLERQLPAIANSMAADIMVSENRKNKFCKRPIYLGITYLEYLLID